MRPQCHTLPINLIVDNQRALVVGGGRVGLRKARGLLDAGMTVRVVAPEMLPEFDTLPIERCLQPFMPEHLSGCQLVIACTDDRAVNRAVCHAAEAAHILCCRADGAWHEGAFIVPAQLRTEDYLVAVSTSGRSCRTAKELRDVLARHLKHCTPGQLVIYGCASAQTGLPTDDALAPRLALVSGVYGWVTLRTCDRAELLAWVTDEVCVAGMLQTLFPLPEAATYFLKGTDAERHFAYVLAGLRARLAGEFHIIGQVREAFNRARDAGHLNGALQTCYSEAQVRAQALRAAITPLLPEVALEELTLRNVRGRVVIAGTGMLARAIAAAAEARGLETTVLHHRTPYLQSIPLERWQMAVRDADRLIVALRTPTPYFKAEEIPCPVYDLGAPRSVTDGAHVIDLDALREVAFREAKVTRQDLESAADAVWEKL